MRTIFLEQTITGWRVKVVELGVSLEPISSNDTLLLPKAVAELIHEGRKQPTASMVLLPENARPVVLRSGKEIVDKVDDGFLAKDDGEVAIARKIYEVIYKTPKGKD